MPQPQWNLTPWQWSTRGILRYGGKPLPLIGTNMPYLDLNDAVSWFTENIEVNQKKILGVKPITFTGESVWISEDHGVKTVKVVTKFDESGGISLPQHKALLTQAGEQWLTTDNLTGLACRCVSVGTPSLITGGVSPFMFKTDLEFLAAIPWAVDLAQTSIAAFPVAGSSGAGTITNFNVTYAGSVHAKPVFVLTIPVSNTTTISQIKLNNTTTGQILTVNFSPALLAGAAITIIIDCNTFQVRDTPSTIFYDPVGSFPVLAPGVVNNFAFTIVSGAATTGVTLSATYFNRWEF